MVGLRPRDRSLLRIGGAALTLAFFAFASHTAFSFGGTEVDSIFNTWVYDGLMLGAAALCLARALLVKRERSVWAVVAFGLTIWTAGEIYYS
ncbi:MAG TPA: hypothetical protein VHM66_06435, partial [Solirubrobacterales bacterium]|nr:hypothetical protein [Solirubrobacterales bacterium]